MSWIDIGLEVVGMPEQDVQDLDRALPGFARIAAAAKQGDPLLTEAKPHVDALIPLLAQAMPHIDALMPLLPKLYAIGKGVYPDIVAVTPTVQELIAFAQSKSG